MGSDLVGEGNKTPEFIVWAQRDKNGAPLQRVQIIKGWVDASGRTHEKVYDVVCSDGLQVDPVTNRCICLLQDQLEDHQNTQRHKLFHEFYPMHQPNLLLFALFEAERHFYLFVPKQ